MILNVLKHLKTTYFRTFLGVLGEVLISFVVREEPGKV